MYRYAISAVYTYPRTSIALSCFGLVKFSGFRDTKTSVNKRLFYVCNDSQKGVVIQADTRPHSPT